MIKMSKIAANRSCARSKISIARQRETLHANCELFVDENFVALGMTEVANEVESSKVSSSSSCQLRKPAYDHQRYSCIYKRSEMARSIVCLRYLLKGSFILLGISGVAICGTGSYFVHRLHGTLSNPEWWYGPPVLLLTTGIVNTILGPYFWFSFDTKYNRPQLLMLSVLVVLVAMFEAGAGIWALVNHGKVDTLIAKILENNLASVGKSNERQAWNITEIKVKCCGFEESSALKDEDDEASETNEISWSCCNSGSYNDDQENEIADTCAAFYTNECRDLALHRYRSVLFYTFVVAFSSMILQILECVGLQAYTKRFLKKIRRQSIVTSVAQSHTGITRPVVQLGAQHVCEGCSGVQYHER